MLKKYTVKLEPAERETLERMFVAGKEGVRKLARARILLKADEGWTDGQISDALDVGTSTVERVRRRFVEEGLEAALNRRVPRRVYDRKVDGQVEAHLIALACSAPPDGYERWTLRLLAERLVELEQVELDSISHETVRQVLQKTSSSPGRRSSG